jgi:hypothetical protein
MNGNTEYLNQLIVGLADLIRDVRLHGRTARFDVRAPGLLEEAMRALKRGTACGESADSAAASAADRMALAAWRETGHAAVN